MLIPIRASRFVPRFNRLVFELPKRRFLERVGFAIVVVGVAALGRHALNPWLDNGSPWLLFYPAVLLASWYGRLACGLLAMVLSIGIAAYCWLEPVHDFRIVGVAGWTNLVAFAVMSLLIVGLTETSHLAMDAERAQRSERERERQFFESALASITDAFFIVDKDWRYIRQ